VAYDLHRDGRRIVEGHPDTAFVDMSVEPGTRYRYAVIAVAETGQKSPPTVVAVTTGEPPTASARFEGRFVLRLTPSSQYGIQGSARGAPAQATFVPTCDKGVCAVDWSVHGENGGGRLAVQGGRYVGTGSSTFRISSCSGATQTETVSMDLKATKAEVRRGEWRVAAVSGTIRESVAATGGCTSAGITWNVTGKLVG